MLVTEEDVQPPDLPEVLGRECLLWLNTGKRPEDAWQESECCFSNKTTTELEEPITHARKKLSSRPAVKSLAGEG